MMRVSIQEAPHSLRGALHRPLRDHCDCPRRLAARQDSQACEQGGGVMLQHSTAVHDQTHATQAVAGDPDVRLIAGTMLEMLEGQNLNAETGHALGMHGLLQLARDVTTDRSGDRHGFTGRNPRTAYRAIKEGNWGLRSL